MKTLFSTIRQRYSSRSLLLSFSTLFCTALLTARVLYTGEVVYAFLLWNLALAWVPYLIVVMLRRHPQYIERSFVFWPLSLVWLLFLPNAFYIITDLFHLPKFGTSMPQWFDLLLVFSTAFTGWSLGTASVKRMLTIVEARWPFSRLKPLVLPALMGAVAFGVYLGRYLRFNSWDLLFNPASLLVEATALLRHPLDHRFEWSMILGYALLFWFMQALSFSPFVELEPTQRRPPRRVNAEEPA